MPQFIRPMVVIPCGHYRARKPVVHLRQPGQLQRLGLLLDRGMHGLNALEHLAHQRCAGWIDEPVLTMPVR